MFVFIFQKAMPIRHLDVWCNDSQTHLKRWILKRTSIENVVWMQWKLELESWNHVHFLFLQKLKLLFFHRILWIFMKKSDWKRRIYLSDVFFIFHAFSRRTRTEMRIESEILEVMRYLKRTDILKRYVLVLLYELQT